MNKRDKLEAACQAAADARRDYDEVKAKLDHYDKLIEDAIMEHTPYASREGMRPGNYVHIELWCRKCSRRWPCQQIQEFRDMFGKVHNWEPALKKLPAIQVIADDD